jgi:hypothetical protein
MDSLKDTKDYSRLNDEERAELRTHFDDAASFDQVEFLLRESEKMMPKNAPAEVFSRLDSLFDQTYSIPKPIARSNGNFWAYSLLAAAAVLLAVFLVYPLFKSDSSQVEKGNQAKKEHLIKPKKNEVIPPEKNIQQEPQEPIIAGLEEDHKRQPIENANDYAPVSLIPNVATDSEDPTAFTSSGEQPYAALEETKAYKTQEQDPQSRLVQGSFLDLVDEFEDRKDQQIAEVATQKKNRKVRARKLDTGSMLKIIKPVF